MIRRGPGRLASRGRRFIPLLVACALAAACGGMGHGGDGDGDGIARFGGDLLGAGATLTITDSVPGDVMVGGRRIIFTGIAGGDFLGAGRDLEIGGRVLGDVRAAGRTVRMTGLTANNATVAGRTIVLAEGGEIGDNAYLAGANLRVDGTIGGSLRATGREVVVYGTVGGDALVNAGSLRVGPGAVIAGDLRYTVPPENVVIDPGAQIMGEVVARAPDDEEPEPPIGVFHVLWLIGFLVAGAVLVALFPGAMGAAEVALRRQSLEAIGWGLVWLIAVPIAVIIVAITVIGLPLALIMLVLYVISLYLGRVVVALWIGRLILRGWAANDRGRLVVAFLVGGVILMVVGLIPVFGGIIKFVATVMGLGALVAAFRTREEAPSQTGPAEMLS